MFPTALPISATIPSALTFPLTLAPFAALAMLVVAGVAASQLFAARKHRDEVRARRRDITRLTPMPPQSAQPLAA